MYTTFIFEPALKKMNISGETLWCVCGAVCSNAHKCSVCLNPVHAICGVTGENEGYGCKVVCSNCNKRGVHASAVASTWVIRDGIAFNMKFIHVAKVFIYL